VQAVDELIRCGQGGSAASCQIALDTCYYKKACVVHDRYHNVMMKMRRVIEGVTRHFTTQFDFDEVNIVCSYGVKRIKGICINGLVLRVN